MAEGMKSSLAALLLLAGCAAPVPAEVDASAYESTCANGCLSKQIQCLQGAGGFVRSITTNTINACTSNRNSCLSACPPK